MTDRTPDDITQWDAAYLLDALNADDRRTYEDYLAAHPERADDLAGLAGLPDLLDVLSPQEALELTDLGAPAAAEPGGVASLAEAAARRERRARRGMLAGFVAAAAALAVLGGVVGATVFPRTPSVQTVAMAPMQPGQREGVTAQLAVTEKKWGTELHWSCEYTRDWAREVDSYDIVVTTRDGRQTAVGSWRPAGDEATGLSAATSIPREQIASIDIRVSGTDQPLAIQTL
ncbi:Conserved membrane protein of uncharacterised function [Mycolicibacterium phlei]|uniref:Anti-sigma factor n=1 Tax=Mycolicibacterium phlei DSM 43239 = CCUG 21000 TaxID=1226750 RepID=A0A5N5V5Z1_MYCPH|nr:hypothetical protein [Mycolicibacterium phlei]VEG10400.1 Conserved membrane protein of uncharacterised function [Mycobacteroides chelonae]AMO62298.1 Anti-sigma-L factor RslA [Mycolicibacterium phlei]KAB7757373.1 hypothetical protein MPHL21000_07740 [Mycolicibacterium phlei DSM 43239 = CCUG 21000]KXW66270.1 hypothetical protein MPHL43239_08325 [Mycolicibacterium phlei DSM 43239 = CCUG 21000]KXW70344.1 hypothetical protein MPHL43072_19570 [Mycolicibacterium phlei DSM 43072]